ncbi:hypothetical protein [Acidimangrovimonas pyrenivorans]|uniref:Uncharacterized protein n=1 Tax=Acidimangrovimonas pyrenivorans TaxID=2030798 RepID=A0ABV7AD91_9RHOB
MNGIVLWSCPETWRAIIWCEDHADLVQARGEACFVAGAAFPEEGDLIACELSAGAGGYQASAVRVLLRGAIPDAAAILRAAVPQASEEAGHAAVPAPVTAPVPASETRPEMRPGAHLAVVSSAPGRRPRLAATAKGPRPALQLAVAS